MAAPPAAPLTASPEDTKRSSCSSSDLKFAPPPAAPAPPPGSWRRAAGLGSCWRERLLEITWFTSAAPPDAILEESLELVVLRSRRRRRGRGGERGEGGEKGSGGKKRRSFLRENFDTNADRRLRRERGEECVPVRDTAVRVRRESQSLQSDFARKLIRVRSVAGRTESRGSRPGLWRVPEGHFHFGVGKPARCTPRRGASEPGRGAQIDGFACSELPSPVRTVGTGR